MTARTSLEAAVMLLSESPGEAMASDFRAACVELADAEAVCRSRDTPATRRRVEECRDRIDAILDMWNAAGHAR
ncbi:hypothetical protein [Geodermatophilus ruber]|nr:hypothetical protein [Geodermatophilus ruber]